MVISLARIYFEAGHAKKATIVPALKNPNYWSVIIHFSDGKIQYLYRKRGGECVYTTLDAAYSAIKSIGFRKANIDSQN